jgi:hypothetical protein
MQRVDDAALKNAAKSVSDGDWLSYGLTLGETRFSPLKQIDASNVKRLGLVVLNSAMVEAIRKPRRSSGTTPFSASPTGASCSQSMQAPANRNGTGIRKSIEPFGPETRSSLGVEASTMEAQAQLSSGALSKSDPTS